jgi:hypothetical protein
MAHRLEIAMSAQTPGLPGQEVVFSLNRGFRRPLVQRGVMAVLIAALAAAAGAALGPPLFVLSGLAGLFAVGCAVAYAWRGRFRTVLTPDGVHIRGYFNHFVPWSAIAGFTVGSREASQSLAGGSGETYATWVNGQRMTMRRSRPPSLLVSVHLVRTKGRRLALRAPLVTGWQHDAEFDDKVRLMEQWRQQYGGPPPVTTPAEGNRIHGGPLRQGGPGG